MYQTDLPEKPDIVVHEFEPVAGCVCKVASCSDFETLKLIALENEPEYPDYRIDLADCNHIYVYISTKVEKSEVYDGIF